MRSHNVSRYVARVIRTVPAALGAAVLLLPACTGGGDRSAPAPVSDEAQPAFCSTSDEMVCATVDEVVSFWGDRPLVDSSVWNRTWVLKKEREARAGQGDSVVSVFFEDSLPATHEEAFDLSHPVIQQTVVTDRGPDGRRFADVPEDNDGSDGLTKRWIDLGGRRMLHLQTEEVDQLQFVERFEGELGVYVEITLAAGRFATLRTVAESLEPAT